MFSELQIIVELILVFILTSFTAGNNLSVCSGTLISSRIVKKIYGVLIGIFGYILGLLLEGSFLRNNISNIILTGNQYFIFIVFSISIVIFLIAHKKRVPESLSITFTSALLGVSFAYGNLNLSFTYLILFFWILAGILAFILSYLMMGWLKLFTPKKNIWKSISSFRIILVILAFFTSFTLGANTLGLIYASLPQNSIFIFVVILGIIFGSVFLSSGEIKRIGNEIIPLRYTNAVVTQFVSVFLVEIATFFGIPLSNTQTLTSGIYGAGSSYKIKLILKKPLLTIITTWIFTAFISFICAYVFTIVLFHL
ncbi:MAG: inorganic phosphate transporter [Candidatus Micrarchaeaceae archaeon]